MKKMCMFVMSVFAVYGMFSAYATNDIAADAESSECVENITGTYSGDANFKAKWTPNNIQLRWYNNNTLMQGVNTESNTCNYGTTLTIPTTPPERTGYIFDGWKVRPKMDFSTLYGQLGSSLGYWARDYHDRNYCRNRAATGIPGETSCTDIDFSDLENKEWKAKFSNGMLYGSSYCSATRGNSSYLQGSIVTSFATYDELENTVGEKRYCWCQATGYKPYSNNPNSIIYGQSSVSAPSVWVAVLNFYTYGSAASCSQNCASNCAVHVQDASAFRRMLLNAGTQ